MSENIDVEQTIANIEKYGDASPKELETQAPAAEEKPFLTFKTNDDLLKYELEYKADQKNVKEDLATILKRAQQGYHYAQNMNKLNSEREGFATEKKTYEQKVAEAQQLNEKWSKFEQYAQQNPQWYDHWNNAWEARSSQHQGQNTADDFQSKLEAALAEKLKPYESLLAEKQQFEEKAKFADQDRLLDEQVKSIRTSYKDIDFDRTNPDTGKSLEFEVLEFMQNNGITNFAHAFKAFYHDNLVGLQVEKQKEAEQKALLEKKKKGIIDEKPGFSGQTRRTDTRNLSWDQVTQLAAKDLGIT